MFAALFVPTMWILFMCSCWGAMACLAGGTACFLADRLRFAPTHSLWHILSAAALYSVLAFSVYANEHCGADGIALRS